MSLSVIGPTASDTSALQSQTRQRSPFSCVEFRNTLLSLEP